MRKTQPVKFDEAKLCQELVVEAGAVGMPAGMAPTIAEKVTEAVAKWVKARPVITVDDLNRRVAEEAMKYSADLAYIYQYRGKII